MPSTQLASPRKRNEAIAGRLELYHPQLSMVAQGGQTCDVYNKGKIAVLEARFRAWHACGTEQPYGMACINFWRRVSPLSRTPAGEARIRGQRAHNEMAGRS